MLALATPIAVPASLGIRGVFFPPELVPRAYDLVLVLDVNESYRPWLVSPERLFEAVDTADSGKKRGLLHIE